MATSTSQQKKVEPASNARLVSIEDFVSGLQKLREEDFSGVQGTLAYMQKTPVDPESLKRFLFWNPQHYTRNLIDKTDLYELLAICWEVGMKSSIHNHKGQNCWMAAPMGKLAVQNYRVRSEDLAGRSATSCLPTRFTSRRTILWLSIH